MPRGAWLESLQGTNAAPAAPAPASTSTPSTPAAGAAPTGFVVTGYARSQATVARALDRLVLMPALSDVSLQTSERTDVGTKKAFKFTIGANVRSAGGTP